MILLLLPLSAAIGASGGVEPPDQAGPPTTRSLLVDSRQMLAMAESSSRGGDASKAVVIYRALLADPVPEVRREARYRLAALLARRGNRVEAAVELRRLLDEWPDAQVARLDYAALLAAMGDDASARRELRALASAPLPVEAARVVERFSQALMARRPVGGSVSIALAPDSNINRATRSDTLGTVIGDFAISEDGKVRSGIGLAVGGEGFARLPLTQRLSLVGRATGSGRLYRDKRFNDLTAGLGAELEYQGVGTRLGAGATRSKRRYGGAPLNDVTQLSLSAAQTLAPTLQARLGLGLAWIDHHRNPLEDGQYRSLSVGLDKALSPVMGVGATVTRGRRTAADPGYAHRALDLAAYGWRDLGRVTIALGAGLGRLDADRRLLLFPERREDKSWRLSAGATFRQLTLFGFAPGITVVQERNASTIEIYDYRRRAAEFTLRRAF